MNSGSYRAPIVGVYSTMVRIGKYGLLYGGISRSGTVVEELVMLNLDNAGEIFPYIDGEEPPARYRHSAVAHGTKMYIFGGYAVDGTLLSDLWSFSVETYQWDYIEGIPDPVLGYPTPRARHSSVANSTHMILVGGIGTSDTLDEIWFLDFRTLQWTGNIDFTLNYPVDCTLALKSESEVYITGCSNPENRANSGGASTSRINIINLKTLSIYKDIALIDNLFRTGSTLLQVSKDRYALLGGTYSTSILPGLFSLSNDTVSVLSDTPALAYAPAVYYKNKFVVFGGIGGRATTHVVRYSPNFTSRDVLVFELDPACTTVTDETCYTCSKGTFSVSGKWFVIQTICLQTNRNYISISCPAGQYSDAFGTLKCKKCPIGTYSNVEGAEDSSVCQHCPHGFYSTSEGAEECTKCNSTNGIGCQHFRIIT